MENFTPKISGAQLNETPETILNEELEKLNNEKNRLKNENSNYLNNHKELQLLLDEFLTQILINKPHVSSRTLLSTPLFPFLLFPSLFFLFLTF